MLKKYDKYKDSGIEWIGQIPENWQLTKIGQVYDERNEKVSDKDFQPLSVTKNGVVPQLETAAKTDNGENRKLVKKNDFAINSRSDRRGSCGISEYEGSVSLINTILAPRKGMCNKFYNYTFKSESFADEFYKWGNGIVDDLWSTKWSAMKNIYIPYPLLGEQQKIADYLDKKCGEIDNAIETEKNVIEKLKEYKQSVITETVTKGLDKSVELKDSGIEWIGKIPKHWNLGRIKKYVYLKTGTTPSSNTPELLEGNFIWYTPSDFTENIILTESERKINRLAKEQNLVPCFPKHTVFIIGIGATTGKIGFSLFDCSCNQQITGMLSKNNMIVTQKFLMYWMLSNTKIIRDTALFTTLPIINNDTLGNYVLLIPTKEEQQQIAEYLDKKCSQIDETIKKKEELIEKLTEYKKSLIYECVTGKRRV